MKKKIKPNSIGSFLSFALLVISFASCQKDGSVNSAAVNNLTTSESAITATQAIAVSASTTTSGDSIYVIGTCASHHHTDSVAFSSLPASVATYLTANYPGYTFQKAFTDKDTTGTVTGYVVIIPYNGKPVGLKFDASGAFVKVLEQREGHDLIGHGWHQGGCFDDRGGLKHDTVAISALPAAITSYLAFNYPGDTLVHALRNRDSSYIVLSSNNGAFATVFTSNGTFVQRIQLPWREGHANSIAETALPAPTTTYLSTTYPDYVFKQAFKIVHTGTVKGYVVLIDANATKYAVEFDASGNFLKAVTIR